MPFFAYILKSLSHGPFYYGSTQNLEARVKLHNAGKVRYTKSRRPWVIHYVESFESRSLAANREKFFKSFEGYRFLKENQII